MRKVIVGILVLFVAGLCFLNMIGDGDEQAQTLHYIVLGDGRAAELLPYAEETDDIEFVTESGADVEWLDGKALPGAAEKADARTVIVVMTGISDMDHAEVYVETLNEWGKKLAQEKDAVLCFNSVNPVTEGVFLPTDVENFNNKIEAGLGQYVRYIDTYSELLSIGFTTTDTLHYSEDSSELLYSLLMKELKKSETQKD